MHIWLNLFHKEWLEHKWQLLSLSAIAIAVFLACGYGEWDEVTQAAMVACVGYALVAPIFVGMSVSATETSQGTLPFVAAQPISLERIALVRWLGGLATLLLPICLVTLSAVTVEVIVQQERRPMDDATGSTIGMFSWHALIVGGVMAANLYAWIVAIAANQRTELRAALIGLVITFVLLPFSLWCFEHFDGPENSSSNRLWSSPVPVLGVLSTPLGGFAWLLLRDQSRYGLIPVSVVWQACTIAALCVMMVLRYGQRDPLRQRIERWRRSGDVAGLRPPQSSPASALVWLQWRESIPVCLSGVAVAFLAIIVTGVGSPQSLHLWRELMTLFLALATGAVSLMIGAVGFTNDLQPKVHTFWRSRPIAPTQWFWLRYGVGFAAIALFYLAPVTVLSVGSALEYGRVWLLAFLPILSLVVYSLGVLCACTIRQPVYAVILAACGAMLIFLVPKVFPALYSVSIEGLLMQVEHPPAGLSGGRALIGAAVAIGIACTISAVITIAAAVSLKRDVYFRT